jgi:hypothetical protein
VVYAATEETQRSAAFERFARRALLLDDGEIADLPPPTWQVDGLIQARSLVLLYAPPGVGKTFVALDIAFSVQLGQAWQDRHVQRGNVIYVIGEGGAGMSARVRAWKQRQGTGEVAGVLFHPGPLDVLKPDQLDGFIDLVGPRTPSLIILDTLARCMAGFEEDSSKDMGLFIDGIERLRTELGSTVLTLHHPTKDGRSERGSGALRGAMDTVLRLVDADRVVTMTCEKQKDAEEAPDIHVTLSPVELLNGGAPCVVVSSLPPQAPPRRAGAAKADGEESDRAGKTRVQQILACAPDGMTPQQIHARLPGVSERTLFRLLRRLKEWGVLTAYKGVYRLANTQTATANPLPRADSGSDSDT